MKQTINLGAYGWRHRHWLNTFYPEDLPIIDDGRGGGQNYEDQSNEDWRLAYYSNEFNTVLVPADYWQTMQAGDCEQWLDSVHADFRFFVQCNNSMLDSISPSDFTAALKMLVPQVSALVFLEQDLLMPENSKKQFIQLADSLQVDIIDDVAGLDELPAQQIWRPSEFANSHFSFIENDLSDLRAVSAMVERFIEQGDKQLSEQVGERAGVHESDILESTIIISHPQLPAENLSKFRMILDIMGC